MNELDINKLIEDYGDNILRLCFLYLKDVQLAEDAVQDTFIKAYKNYKKFNHQSSEKTWLTRIAINVCKNYLRTMWFKKVECKDELQSIYSDEFEKKQDNMYILDEIIKLSPKYKTVILLFYYEDMSISEISKILKIPVSTVSTRLKRAKQKLKLSLERWYYNEYRF